MNRRRYLATAGAVTSAALAGCTGVRGERRLDRPSEETERQTVYQTYEHDGTAVLTVSHLVDRWTGDAVRLRVLLHQPLDTSLTSFSIQLAEEGLFPDSYAIFVEPPRRAQFEGVDIDRRDGAVSLEVDDPGDGGRGTVTLEFLAVPYVDLEGASSLRISHDIELSEDGWLGSSYTAGHWAVLDLDELLETG